MKIIRTISQMKAFSCQARDKGKNIGFVPTMGALHNGHLMLVEQAIGENDITVCSIFVNPIQFNNPQDLEKYPRTFEKDVAKLEALGCDVVFSPQVEEMYPTPETKVYDFGLLDKVMEGRFRAGHFNGVAIVVRKLFDIVLPCKAYFGEKDFQQLAIIKELVKKEALKVDIISCPTVREPDGLAMSSRNVRLNKSQRHEAPLIYKTLIEASQMYKEYDTPEEVIEKVSRIIDANPQMELEYFEISEIENLRPVRNKKPKNPVVACIAVHMGSVRLIDNIRFNL